MPSPEEFYLAPITDKEKELPPEFPKPIDRQHHVPLVASALTDDNGHMYGMAIDHRIPPKPEYEKHLWNHEQSENSYMNDLVKNGEKSQDAYHKAHDWATGRESAAVEAEFGKDGLEAYKQHWRDAAAIAAEPTDRARHPEAHTTRHGLDESELGKLPPNTAFEQGALKAVDYAKEFYQRGLFGVAKKAGMDPPGQKMSDIMTGEPMQTTLGLFGGIGAEGVGKAVPWLSGRWFRGAEGKLRFEIPDVDSQLTLSKAAEAIKERNSPEDPHVTLGEMLHHPELYKFYPELQDFRVYHDPSMPMGSGSTTYYGDVPSHITMGPMESEEDLHNVLLHEVQHVIQYQEGFLRGASTERMTPYVLQALKNLGLKPSDFGLGGTDIKAQEKITEAIREAAFQAYGRVAGEVEARNVQTRMYRHPAAMPHPLDTQDYPFSKQLNPPKPEGEDISQWIPWTNKELEMLKRGEDVPGRSAQAKTNQRVKLGISNKAFGSERGKGGFTQDRPELETEKGWANRILDEMERIKASRK